MVISFDSLFSENASLPDEPAARAAVARLVLSVVHDSNGFLATAVLRSASVRRSLAQLRAAKDLSQAERLALHDRIDAGQAHIDEALAGLRSFLDELAAASWELEPTIPSPEG